MAQNIWKGLLICLFYGLIHPAASSAAGLQAPKAIKFSEAILRKKAARTVRPSYPATSRKQGVQGVAVAQLEIDEKGRVSHVDILEAPDAAIKEAVTNATMQWEFIPSTIGGEPVRIVGKLTFYFVMDKGKARVEDPKVTQ